MVNKFITYVPSCMRKRGKRILGVKFKKGVSDSVPSCKIYIQQSAALFVCGPRSLFILCFTWFWKNPSYSFQWLTFLFPNYLSQFIQWKTIPFWFPTLDFSTTSSLHIIRSGKNIYLISVFSRIWFSINTYLDLFYALLDYEKIQAIIFDVEQTLQVFSGEARIPKVTVQDYKGGANRGYWGNNVRIAWNLASWRTITFWSKLKFYWVLPKFRQIPSLRSRK